MIYLQELGLTKGKNTREYFYSYLNCFYKIVNENGLEINDNTYPVELNLEINNKNVIRENLAYFREKTNNFTLSSVKRFSKYAFQLLPIFEVEICGFKDSFSVN